MRGRTAVLMPMVLMLVTGVTTPAVAASPGPRPTVTVGDLSGPTEGPEGSQQWWLAVDAVDPDGVIWEVEVRWSDGEVALATTSCLQGAEPGTPAHLLIPHSFASSGRYIARVLATSLQGCPLYGPPGAEQTSHPVVKVLTFNG